MTQFKLTVMLLIICIANTFGDVTTATNKMCPVMPDEEIDIEVVTEYQGQKVYFCCKKCLSKFLKSPQTYLANLPQFSQDQGHSHDDHQHSGEFQLLNFIGKFHPLTVHFPIALMISAVLAELLLLKTRKTLFRDGARFMVFVAAITAIVAVALGWAAGMFATYKGELSSVLSQHRLIGTITGVCIIITAIFSEMYHRRQQDKYCALYRIFLVISAILVSISGHLGGTLIYGIGHIW